MADTFNLISNISFILAGIFFLLSLFLFYRFNIRKIVGDLSGRNARKSIDAMKQVTQTSEVSGVNYIYKRDIRESSEQLKPSSSFKTEELTNIQLEEQNVTTILGETVDATTVLGENSMGTTVLSNAQLMPKEQQFIVTKEITFIHGAVTL